MNQKDNDKLREALEVYAKREEQEGFFNSVAHKALAASKPEPQAQAGEPEVVAYVLNKENLLGTRLLGYKPDGEDCIELITLQSHREAIAKRDAAL